MYKEGGIMKTFEFYQQLYLNEQNIRYLHEQKLYNSLTVLSFMVIADFYILNIVLSNPQIYSNFLLILIICIFLALFITQVIFLFGSYMSFNFKYCDFPVDKIRADIYKYMCDNNIHFNNNSESQPELQIVNTYAENMLSRTYEHCASINYKENLRRRINLHKLNICHLFNIIFIVLCFIYIYMKGGFSYAI